MYLIIIILIFKIMPFEKCSFILKYIFFNILKYKMEKIQHANPNIQNYRVNSALSLMYSLWILLYSPVFLIVSLYIFTLLFCVILPYFTLIVKLYSLYYLKSNQIALDNFLNITLWNILKLIYVHWYFVNILLNQLVVDFKFI